MRKKIVLVLIIAAAAAGTAFATQAKKNCEPRDKKLFCADGRIVCCPRGDACDCGG